MDPVDYRSFNERCLSFISLANSLTQALHNITGARAAPEGQEVAGVQLGPGQAHPDSFSEYKQIRLSPQIRLLYGIKSKAAISLTFDLHCKSIAAVFFIPVCRPI